MRVTLWLSQQEGFPRGIKAVDASYFQLSRRDEAEARAALERPAPSIHQAQRALDSMPSETPRQMREVATSSANGSTHFFAKDFNEAEAPLRRWMTYLEEVALYAPDDPLFPATVLTARTKEGFKACGFTRTH